MLTGILILTKTFRRNRIFKIEITKEILFEHVSGSNQYTVIQR